MLDAKVEGTDMNIYKIRVLVGAISWTTGAIILFFGHESIVAFSLLLIGFFGSLATPDKPKTWTGQRIIVLLCAIVAGAGIAMALEPVGGLDTIAYLIVSNPYFLMGSSALYLVRLYQTFKPQLMLLICGRV